MKRENIMRYSKKIVIILLIISCIILVLDHVANIILNSYSEMMELIEKGDLKAALEKCKSPFMRGMGKYKLEILEATYNKDVNQTISAIKNDVCYGKCYHIIDDWRDMIIPYLKSQPDEAGKTEIMNYIKSVRKKLKDEENIELGINLKIIYDNT